MSNQHTRQEADRLVREALIRHKQGDLEHAYRVYMQVIAAFPDHAAALHYLGLLAQQTGHSEKAMELLQRSIRLNPSDARAYSHLAQVLLTQNRVNDAVECFLQGLAVDPRHVDSMSNLANALKLRGELPRAIELYRRAIEIEPNSINSTFNLANAMKDMHEYGEALRLFGRALNIQPDHLQSHHALGLLLEQMGRFTEAIEHYRAVRRIDPRHSKSLAKLIAIRSYEPDPQTVNDAEELLRSLDPDEEDRVKLHHGLGKHYDRQQDFDEAFRHFSAASAILKKRSAPFDVRAVADYFNRLIATFSADYFAGLGESRGSASNRPVFIVGMPRSGTTLTEQVLASHPKIFGAGELQGIPELVRSLQPLYPESLPDMPAQRIEELANRYLAGLKEHAFPDAARIVDKLPVNFTHLGLIATLFPRARIIHCVRDPLDIGLSCFIELFKMDRDFTTDLESIGQYILQYERLMAHWRKVLPLVIYEQRYEYFVDNQEAGSRALIEHCGLSWDTACLDFQKTDRAIMTPSRWQVRQPIYRSSVGRWRNYARHMEPLQRELARGRAHEGPGA